MSDHSRAGAVATGIGSLPGTSPLEAARTVAGELPDLPHVVELPARGPGADIVGRTAALLAQVAPDLAVDTTPAGWRFADAPGRTVRRAAAWLAEDLDAIEQEYTGATRIKAQLCGPWTLAAAIELRTGERAVRDHGACRDLAHALAEAAARHVADLRRRLPGADVVLQLDEPSLPTVLAGGVTTASGLATYRAVHPPRAQDHLTEVVTAITAAGAQPAIHCCDRRAPIDLLQRSGFRALSVDLSVLDGDQAGPLGAALDDGLDLYLGVIPALPQPLTPRQAGERAAAVILTRLDRWGFPPESVAHLLTVTPTCGLAGATPTWVRTAYAAAREAVRLLTDAEEGDEGSGT